MLGQENNTKYICIWQGILEKHEKVNGDVTKYLSNLVCRVGYWVMRGMKHDKVIGTLVRIGVPIMWKVATVKPQSPLVL